MREDDQERYAEETRLAGQRGFTEVAKHIKELEGRIAELEINMARVLQVLA